MPKIMVVDDEATITTQLEERLTHMGYKVIGTASNGRQAIEEAREKKPDIVLMDIVMPGKPDGIEAAAILKKELGIPVVFLTAYGNDRMIRKAKAVEPLGYLLKPYQENSLKAALEIALQNRDIIKQLQDSAAKTTDREATDSSVIKIDFATYINKIINRLIKAYKIDPGLIKINIDITIPELDLPTAIPCGIILSELLSNSFKHAFPRGQKGEVWVGLTRTGNAAYTLKIKDNGSGLPDQIDPLHPLSSGLQTACNLVEQLNGTLQLDRRDGTDYSISFPAAQV